MKGEMDSLESRKAALADLLADAPADTPDILPSASAIYAKKVAALTKALNQKEERQAASQDLRALIEKIVPTPGPERGEIYATLHGELGTIIEWTEWQAIGKAAHTTKPAVGSAGLLESLVAGAGFKPAAFRLRVTFWQFFRSFDRLSVCTLLFDKPRFSIDILLPSPHPFHDWPRHDFLPDASTMLPRKHNLKAGERRWIIGTGLDGRMDAMAVKLTKRSIEQLAVKEQDYIAFDSELPGFGVRVMPSGRRFFLVQYRRNGRSRRVMLGMFGPITAEIARKEATRLLGNGPGLRWRSCC